MGKVKDILKDFIGCVAALAFLVSKILAILKDFSLAYDVQGSFMYDFIQ